MEEEEGTKGWGGGGGNQGVGWRRREPRGGVEEEGTKGWGGGGGNQGVGWRRREPRGGVEEEGTKGWGGGGRGDYTYLGYLHPLVPSSSTLPLGSTSLNNTLYVHVRTCVRTSKSTHTSLSEFIVGRKYDSCFDFKNENAVGKAPLKPEQKRIIIGMSCMHAWGWCRPLPNPNCVRARVVDDPYQKTAMRICLFSVIPAHLKELF